MKFRFDILVIIILLAICAFGFLLIKSTRAGTQILVLVPDSFRGVAKMESKKVIPLTAYSIWIVSPEGKVLVDDLKVLSEWHSYKAKYYSGAELPVAPTASKVTGLFIQDAPDSVRLFVGTAAEAHTHGFNAYGSY